MSKLKLYRANPAFLRRKSYGIYLERDDCIQIAHRQDVEQGELAKSLREHPIELTVRSVDHAPPKGLRIVYSAPWGVQVKILRSSQSNQSSAEQCGTRRPSPIRGVHRSLVLTRYPSEAVHWFPAFGSEDAAYDLTQNAIFVNITKIINDRVTLQISASDKWTVLRSELELQPRYESRLAATQAPRVGEDHVIPAGASAATLRFEQLTQLALHYHDALACFPAELTCQDITRTLSQEHIARFLTVERQIRSQHAALANALNVMNDYKWH